MIRHDWPAGCPIHHPAAASFTAPNSLEVIAMTTLQIEAPNWLPRLINWLAVLVLLSLGVLL
jgi:hypothetical protein